MLKGQACFHPKPQHPKQQQPKQQHQSKNTKTKTKMIELFIELTDQLFWEGYAEQLAKESPAVFQQELNGFMDSYNG